MNIPRSLIIRLGEASVNSKAEAGVALIVMQFVYGNLIIMYGL